MAARKIVEIGDPRLREKSRTVDPAGFGGAELRELVEDMVDSMHAAGGIGIAAPQIGVSLRVAVIEIDPATTRYPGAAGFPSTVIVNPRVTVLDPAMQSYWEGCLSVPNLRGLVHRPRAVRVEYVDLEGAPHAIEAEGFLATVFQHELDHLDGVLFVDKVRDTRHLATVENYARFWVAPGSRPVDI